MIPQEWDIIWCEPSSISYSFTDFKKEVMRYCGKNFLYLKDFLAWCWVSDQLYRYWEWTGYVTMGWMRKIRKAYPDINFSRVKMINGILWPKFEYQFRKKEWRKTYKPRNNWEFNLRGKWDNQSTESYEEGYDYIEQDRV